MKMSDKQQSWHADPKSFSNTEWNYKTNNNDINRKFKLQQYPSSINKEQKTNNAID